MKIILFGHPRFYGSHSMNLFAEMIVEGMRHRGHEVEFWSPRALVHRLPAPASLRKWFGYVDQYIIFPFIARWRLRSVEQGTLIVLADHALGMWMPIFRQRPHIIHCHDFIAIRTLEGDFPQLRLSVSGHLYQSLIRWGVCQGKAFISVSQKTASDLARFFRGTPEQSFVIYNGLNYPFCRLNPDEASARLRRAGIEGNAEGFLMHVGSNQWYKNREGVLALYEAYCRLVKTPRAMWMIGAEPSQALLDAAARADRCGGQVRFLTGVSTEALHAAYSMATALIFPSLEEGFGWPIIEAMACGTPVLTTDRAPMSEIAGGAAQLVEPMNGENMIGWAARNAHVLADMAEWTAEKRVDAIARSIERARRFSADDALDRYERAYRSVLQAAACKQNV
jgi:glycosyltransferase involved in cell wall biosynthesis